LYIFPLMYMYIFRPRALVSIQVLFITKSVSVLCIVRAYGLLCTLNGLQWAGVWGGPAPASYKYVLQTLMIIHSPILASNMVSSVSFPPSATVATALCSPTVAARHPPHRHQPLRVGHLQAAATKLLVSAIRSPRLGGASGLVVEYAHTPGAPPTSQCRAQIQLDAGAFLHHPIPRGGVLWACLFPVFHHFFISFREIKKLDDSKSEKLEAPFHELLSFSLLGPSSFWISLKLIQKSGEKLKQTGPQSASPTKLCPC
jgi:hypothetical protein